MKVITHPSRGQWAELTARSSEGIDSEIRSSVDDILEAVRSDGDKAVRQFTARFDNAEIREFKLSIREVDHGIATDLKEAIGIAFRNIQTFHNQQILQPTRIDTQPGVTCWREARPISPVGLYIPGGTAPLFSSLLMLGIPAKLAGCRKIVVCTPPAPDGSIHPTISYTASLLGIDEIYTVGGAQAIAAMAFGTESIPGVQKIFGPGNAYVTAAKQAVQSRGIAIDMPAGPSELLVIADETSNPAFVASDLLSQAEHGPDSQVILVTDHERVVDQVLAELDRQLAALPRRKIARAALRNSRAVIVKSLEEAIAFSNAYAPEHLIINTANARQLTDMVDSAGSVFIGPWSCESLGDYASGTNHTLPTAGFARNYSGVSVDSFVKKITFQQIDRQGFSELGPAVETMARAEGLAAHERAVSIRLKSMADE